MLPRRRSALFTMFACAMVGGVALPGCSVVPTSGPSKDAIVTSGTKTVPPYLLIRMSDFVIQKLERFPGPSLYGKFGDYRGALEQRVGVGDTLRVTIFEAAAGGLFSGASGGDPRAGGGSHSAVLPTQLVQRDGSITVPYAGRVAVAGRTVHEIEQDIVTKLTGKAIEPQIVVSLSQNIASAVTLQGESVKGARVPLTAAGDRLLDVIATGGGISTPVYETFLELTRSGRTVRVPFQTLLNTPRENIFARPDDVLTVVRYPLTFTAVGATGTNAIVPFSAVGISLEEAIGKSSGLSDGRADPEGVFVFRYEPVSVVRDYPGLTPQQAALNLVPTVYILNMRDARSLFLARKFSVHDKDIVFVSNSPYVEITKVINILNTVLSPALGGFSLGQTVAGSTTSSNLAVLSAASASSASSAARAAPVAAATVQ